MSISEWEHSALHALRKLHSLASPSPANQVKPTCSTDPEYAAIQIDAALSGHSPAMIARFGSTELACLANYLAITSPRRSRLDYIRRRSDAWWWNKRVLSQMNLFSGFFPVTSSGAENFCRLMLRDVPEVDILGSWLPNELLLHNQLEMAIKIDLELLNPYFSTTPWTRALRHKKVLVVHPFASTIENQYRKRALLFSDDLLPEFQLITIKAVQTVAGQPSEYLDWFAALDAMKSAMDQIDYDIALIGCGAYGFPLAAHAKRAGKKGFHLGGSLQLLFGISGRRWENPNYNPHYNFSRLMNEHWVKPSEGERPINAEKVEGACYW